MSYASTFPPDSIDGNNLINASLQSAGEYLDVKSDSGEEFNFFECVPSLNELEKISSELDELSPAIDNDALAISDIYLPQAFINCDHHTSYDVTLDVCPDPGLAPSSEAYLASVMEEVDLSY